MLAGHLTPTLELASDRYVVLAGIDPGWPDPAPSARVGATLDLPEGVSAMLAMSVRLFLIAIVALTIAAVAFLIATA